MIIVSLLSSTFLSVCPGLIIAIMYVENWFQNIQVREGPTSFTWLYIRYSHNRQYSSVTNNHSTVTKKKISYGIMWI